MYVPTHEQFDRETARFGVSYANGGTATVVEFTTFARFTPVNQPTQTLKGKRHYQLDDGTPVNWIDDDTFENVSSGEVMRKV